VADDVVKGALTPLIEQLNSWLKEMGMAKFSWLAHRMSDGTECVPSGVAPEPQIVAAVS
jgi:hypothetical protein